MGSIVRVKHNSHRNSRERTKQQGWPSIFFVHGRLNSPRAHTLKKVYKKLYKKKENLLQKVFAGNIASCMIGSAVLRAQARSEASESLAPSTRRSSGSMIARSSSYGSPRWRPRIIMMHITTFPNGVNFPQRDTLTLGYPRLRPTLALELTVSILEKENEHGGIIVLCRRDFEKYRKQVEGL